MDDLCNITAHTPRTLCTVLLPLVLRYCIVRDKLTFCLGTVRKVTQHTVLCVAVPFKVQFVYVCGRLQFLI